MGFNYAALKAEIDADPLTRGYAGMTDQQLTDSLNAADRSVDSPAADGALFNYLAQQKARESPTEGTASHIYGRLKRAAGGVIGADTFEVGGASLSYQRKDGCETLLHMAEADRLGGIADDLATAEIADILDEVIAAGVMKAADKTAIIALSQGLQSRAVELGLGLVRVGHVEQARSM